MYAYFVSVASFVSDIYLSLLQNGAVSNIHTRIQNGGNGAERDVIVQIKFTWAYGWRIDYLGSPRRSITGMSDRELFIPSEEESDSRGPYETPIRYKDYVGLSKSSSAVKRRRYSPLVLQTSCSSGEDDYPPLPKPKTDRRKSEVNGRRSQVLSSTIERTQVKCRRQGEWMCWYPVTWWYRESIVRARQTNVERCPTPCWQVWEANKLFWEQAWGKCKQHFRWFYPIKKEGAGSRRSEGKRLVPGGVYVQWLCRSHSVFFSGPLGGEIPPPPPPPPP